MYRDLKEYLKPWYKPAGMELIKCKIQELESVSESVFCNHLNQNNCTDFWQTIVNKSINKINIAILITFIMYLHRSEREASSCRRRAKDGRSSGFWEHENKSFITKTSAICVCLLLGMRSLPVPTSFQHHSMSRWTASGVERGLISLRPAFSDSTTSALERCS